jgi:predicted nucleotidyltransferase
MLNLDEKSLTFVRRSATAMPGVDKVILFGSRATGRYHTASDIDLAVAGNLTPPDIWKISGLLNDESPTPYCYDVLHYDSITNNVLMDEIDSTGIIIFERK